MTELEQAHHDLRVADVVNGKLVSKLDALREEISKADQGQDCMKTVESIRDILFDNVADQVSDEDVEEVTDLQAET